MPSAVAQLLKQRTSETHRRVEALLGLLDPELSVSRLQLVLGRFAGFWHSAEQVIDDWADGDPTFASALRWPRRRRREALRCDLLRLGLTVREQAALPRAPAVFDCVDTAAVLGWLYVSEGSTLGGALIDRRVQALPEGARLRLRTFAPYLEGPGPMWRSYLCCLSGWVGEDVVRRDEVVAAAELTFTALERWLAPLSNEAAA